MERSTRRKSSLLPTSTNKKSRPSSSNYGFRSSRKSNMTPSHSRASFAPSKSIKDPRQLDNPSIRKKEVHYLYNFLLDIGFQNDKFALERLHPPSNTMYQAIFSHLVTHLVHDWTLLNKSNKRSDESMLNILRTLGYPYAISKSHLANVVPGTWQHALGALLWLAKVVKYCMDCAPKIKEKLEEDAMREAKHYFFRRCYEEFMDDNDGPYCEVESQVQQRIDDINKDRSALIEEHQNELERIQGSCNEKLRLKEKFDSTVTAIETEKGQIAKVQDYLHKVESYIESKQQARVKSEQEIEEKREELVAEEKLIAQMRSTVSMQKYSQSDMERLHAELKNWEEQSAEMGEKNKTLQKEFNAVSAKLLKVQQKDRDMINLVNEEIRSYLTRTDDEDLIEDQFDINDFLLNENETNPQNNKHHTMGTVIPFMHVIHDKLAAKSKLVAADCKQIENKLSEAEERTAELDEEVKRSEEQNTVLEAKLEKLKEEYLDVEREQAKREEEFKKTMKHLETEEEEDEGSLNDLEEEIKKLKEENVKTEEENRRNLEAFRREKELGWVKLRDEYNKKMAKLEQTVQQRQQVHKMFMTDMTRMIDDVERSGEVMNEIETTFQAQQEAMEAHVDGTDEQMERVNEFLQRATTIED